MGRFQLKVLSPRGALSSGRSYIGALSTYIYLNSEHSLSTGEILIRDVLKSRYLPLTSGRFQLGARSTRGVLNSAWSALNLGQSQLGTLSSWDMPQPHWAAHGRLIDQRCVRVCVCVCVRVCVTLCVCVEYPFLKVCRVSHQHQGSRLAWAAAVTDTPYP